MSIEYSTPLTLYTKTTRENLLMLEAAAEIPFHAVSQARLGKLALSYAAHDFGTRRALGTISHATKLHPDDIQLADLKTELFESAALVHP